MPKANKCKKEKSKRKTLSEKTSKFTNEKSANDRKIDMYLVRLGVGLGAEATKLAYRELNQIFNAAADGIRVIDKNLNILRVNEAFLTLSGMSKDEVLRKKCYEVFSNSLCRTSRCPLSRIIGGDKDVECEVEIECRDGKRIYCILTATSFWRFKGELMGIIESFRDISKYKQVEERLRLELKYEKLVTSIFGKAISVKELPKFINASLKEIGKTLGVSRVYICEYYADIGTMSRVYEWAEKGISPQKENLQDVAAFKVPWLMEVMCNNQPISFADIEDMPGREEREIFRAQHVKSTIAVPFHTSKGYHGFLGLDECRKHREWQAEDRNLLRSIAQVISGVIGFERKELETIQTKEAVKRFGRKRGLPKVKVLVVDDDVFVADVFRRYLSLEGCEVTVAKSGSEALEKLKAGPFGAIFLDIVMPDMDGVETLRVIKKVDQQIPVVMMTGFQVEDKIREAKRLGALDCLYKPFGIGQLSTVTDKALRK